MLKSRGSVSKKLDFTSRYVLRQQIIVASKFNLECYSQLKVPWLEGMYKVLICGIIISAVVNQYGCSNNIKRLFIYGKNFCGIIAIVLWM